MNCPVCNAEINPAAIMGKAGGKKSRRVLTREQARAMADAKRKKREGNDYDKTAD